MDDIVSVHDRINLQAGNVTLPDADAATAGEDRRVDGEGRTDRTTTLGFKLGGEQRVDAGQL